MAFDNERIVVLQNQIARKAQLETKIRQLNSDRYPIKNNVIKLETEMNQAIEHENELNKFSFASLLHTVTGKLDNKRDEAHKQVNAAKSKYGSAVRTLNEIDDSIANAQEELSKIFYCERDYKQAYEDKIVAIKKSNHPDKGKLLELEKKIDLLQHYILELKGAISSGDSARATTAKIISLEDSAYDISASDLFFRHSLIENAIDSRDRLKEAKQLTGKVYEQLDRFKNRLVDVSAFAKDYADISFFTKFIEWIHESKKREFYPESVLRQLKNMLNKLDIVVNIIENKCKEVKSEYDAIVLQINV